MELKEFVRAVDVWFDLSTGTTRLLAAIPADSLFDTFIVEMDGESRLRFRHLADIKGQRIFEAFPQRLGCAEGPSELGPILRLEGPYRRDR
jgi:hypothetical protein